MLPMIKRVFRAFFLDELAFRRWVRGGLLLFAAGGVAFADGLASLIGEDSPSVVKGIKIAAVVCGFLGGAVTAGERNPKPAEPPPQAQP